jgi:anti-sigma factor RsiW
MTDTTLCPDDELLIGYVNGDVPAADLDRIGAHLDTCDRCVENARAVSARLRATAEPLESPPPGVLARAQAALAPQPALAGNRRVPLLLRLPILIPMSLAAGALLVVGTHTWLAPHPPRVLNRAVQIQRTTHAAAVHARPSAQASVVASLNAGEMVEVHATQPGWYRIALPDGGEGWVEAQALE